MQIVLIVNSFASSVNPRNTVQVHQYLARRHGVQVVETNERGHATRFARDAAARGVDAVVAFGGDGTLNEVATGLAGSGTALAILPGGSTNVFARSLGTANDPIVALQQVGAGLDEGAIHPVSLGRANGRYFCFHAGFGFDAAVVETVERRASLKRVVGQPLFVAATLQNWFAGYDRRFPHFAVEADGRRIPNGYFTVVLNTSPYTYVGRRPMHLDASASLEKRLVVVTFRRLTTPLIVASAVRALRAGGITPSRSIDVQRDVEQVRLTHAEPFPYQLDGDYVGAEREVVVEHQADALRLVHPVVVG